MEWRTRLIWVACLASLKDKGDGNENLRHETEWYITGVLHGQGKVGWKRNTTSTRNLSYY
jgi:hypothetical protein